MRILKIELQNINSLKSDAPIIIDFENEYFKDVGLYAITGATGAGKTTILDAITISLYHSVPRFKGTKGSLIDVVSYSAHDAFSRVTFENNDVVYEAYWGIRLKTQTGKELKNPQEELSFKDLTNELTLATQKTLVKSEIIRVTQLDYDQFLRSVMLAQGDFASFLSAKGPDKGRLLEQITGEEIYKKIGQAALDRRTFEEKKLLEIKAKINSDDILDDEARTKLENDDKELIASITDVNKDLTAIQNIVNWYQEYDKLINKTKELEDFEEKIKTFKEKYKSDFLLLELDEKASPFKDLIADLNRNEKNRLVKIEQLSNLEKQLAELKPKIEQLKNLSAKQNELYNTANLEFSNWLPKFDKITNLDGQISNEFNTLQKIIEQIDNVKTDIDSYEKEQLKITKNIEQIKGEIKLKNDYIKQNNFLKSVDSERSKWTSDLSTLKSNKETLIETTRTLNNRKLELDKANTDFNENKKLLKNESLKIEALIKENTALSNQLKKNNFSDLLAQKDLIYKNKLNWEQYQNLAKEKVNAENEIKKAELKKEEFNDKLIKIKTQISSIQNEIETQEKSVDDAERILNLEKSISKYADDRKNLIKGEACGLCGSKEHPFAENLISKGVSNSEEELINRRNKLKNLQTSKSEFEINESKFQTNIDYLNQQISTIKGDLNKILLKAKELNLDCDLSNSSKITNELNLSINELDQLDKKIKATEDLRKKFDDFNENLNTQKQSADLLNTKNATLSEKIKNITSDIESKQNTIDNLTIICGELEDNLRTKLAKFNFELPAIENINSFIENLDKSISLYYNSEKELAALNSNAEMQKNKLEITNKQLSTLAETQKENIENKIKSELTYKELKNKRSDILPFDITVENKRKNLQLNLDDLLNETEESKKNLQNLLDTEREKNALVNDNKKEQIILGKAISLLESNLDVKVKSSDFESKEDIEKAILPFEIKEVCSKNKERLKENEVKLKTLKETNQKELEALNKSKNFETTVSESKQNLDDLKIKKDLLSTRKGEIIEALRKDKEIKDRNQEIYAQINEQENICKVWRELFKVLGNSKDAFNIYVQRLTLKQLLDLANVHLYKLNKRYSLNMPKTHGPNEELNFNLIDHYQTNQTRLVDTSSGGEKFIISLALALGLSDLASKNVKIDSLFIDEGFGTLDKNTLETVISTLETLQSQGKMIGIISHVENLKERITTQIQITKKSNGVSIVEFSK